MSKNYSTVLSVLATIQARYDLHKHLNVYVTAEELYEIYNSLQTTVTPSITKTSFVRSLNYIVDLGFNKEHQIEIFKRQKRLRCKKYLVHYFIKSSIRRSPRTLHRRVDDNDNADGKPSAIIATSPTNPQNKHANNDDDDNNQTIKKQKHSHYETSTPTRPTLKRVCKKSTAVVHTTDAVAISSPPTVTPTKDPSPFIFTPTPPFDNITKAYIDSASNLDFDTRPRPDANDSSTHIEICDESFRVKPAECTKWMMVAIVSDLGISKVSKANKLLLCKAVIDLESYNAGYASPSIQPKTLLTWYYDFVRARNKKVGKMADLFKVNYERPSYIDEIEASFPGFLHRMYRQATKTLGHDAPIRTLYHHMNIKARQQYLDCPTRGSLTLNKYHFRKWFRLNGGKFRKCTTKPTLTAQQRQDRLDWAKNIKNLIKNDDFHYCFLDEKWFYIQSKRSVYKILPPGPGETVEDAFVQHPKVHSRRFPVKAMFMGVVAPPNLERDFDGAIMIERISRMKITKQKSYSQRFADNFRVNELIRTGAWKDECYNTISVGELAIRLQEKYALDHSVTHRICVSYHTFGPASKTKKMVRLSKNDIILDNRMFRCTPGTDERILTLDDVDIHVEVPAGTHVEEDCTCDSDFMLDIIRDVGSNIRRSFWWLSDSTVIHLFMDNAGGHGSNSARKEYVRILQDEYKVQIIWQIANSPETNMLDLGAWVTIQCIVAHMHRGKRMHKDALCKTVNNAFESLDSSKLASIGKRWIRVLDLIVVGKGSNDLVEQCRGLTTSLADLPDLDYDDIDEL
jgi:hypothetical protein